MSYINLTQNKTNKMMKAMTSTELLATAYKQQAQIETLIQDNQKLLTDKETVEKLFEVILPIAEEIKNMSWINRVFRAVSLAMQIATFLINHKVKTTTDDK